MRKHKAFNKNTRKNRDKITNRNRRLFQAIKAARVLLNKTKNTSTVIRFLAQQGLRDPIDKNNLNEARLWGAFQKECGRSTSVLIAWAQNQCIQD